MTSGGRTRWFLQYRAEFDLPLGKWPIRADNVKLKRAYTAAAADRWNEIRKRYASSLLA
ncbi:hypothetical protein [Candidatus Phyllobacterium onerii]|uniref:hypothetical protein n=1 Tax=Candidatus Phyllobacterium onerii TaxID=3020828 RepID=UPI00232E2EBF|nr:hypothetical protein [Phyllobacterium sp. IY22]